MGDQNDLTHASVASVNSNIAVAHATHINHAYYLLLLLYLTGANQVDLHLIPLERLNR